MINKACHRLINSVWTMTYTTLDNGTVKVLAYNREDEDGYKFENIMPELTVLEDEDRIIRDIKIDDKVYIVSNPKHIFSY